MSIFEFLNDQLLKMVWLSDLVSKLLLDVFQLSETSIAYGILQFFLYDTVKIFLLLSVLIFISSYIQTYLTIEKTQKILSKTKGVFGNIIGALLGTITPFCSCSSIPIFIGFTKAKLPIGVTMSFLISSPLVDMASVILLASVFSWKIAIYYVIIGLAFAIVGGVLFQIFKMDRYIADFIKEDNGIFLEEQSEKVTVKKRAQVSFGEVKNIVRRVWIYILLGVFIGSFIHGVIPEDWVLAVLGRNSAFSVFLATIIGIPMYADIFGTLPIAEALVFKGVQLGTVLAFMMAVTTLSIPSIVMLSQVAKKKLIIFFLGYVTVGIWIIGVLFNAFQGILV